MKLRLVLPALMIGAGMLLPLQTPAQAKTSYKQPKNKKYKAAHRVKNRNFKKNPKFKSRKAARHKVTKHR